MKTLVTGCAGFIGSKLSLRLLEAGHEVIGVDCISDYYDPQLKHDRLAWLKPFSNFSFKLLNIADRLGVESLFREHRPTRVVNLAAQAGVRYSLVNPGAYIESNIQGFLNILEQCRHNEVEHLIYASSSSVYGANRKMPFSVDDNVDHPVSLYAASKKSNELMAHAYSHMFGLPTTGLRFFTVYGPWGRPDMALFIFTKNILEGKPIDVFNHGKHHRDFTYIDDIVDGIVHVWNNTATPNLNWDSLAPSPGTSLAPYRVYNIGNSHPVALSEFISAIEETLGKKAKQNMLPLMPGDVPDTYADVSALQMDFGFSPKTNVRDGIRKFVEWYRQYYRV